jgi:two-component system, OmpR family, phosphate regulon sensor histidine kinase PhoR
MWIALSFIFLVAAIVFYWRGRKRLERCDTEQGELKRELAHAREEHADQEAKWRCHEAAIFNSMVEGILILDAQGRVHTINKSLERLFALQHDVRGQTIMEAFRTHELLEIAERAQKEGQVRAFELSLPGIQQSRYLEVNAASMRLTGDRADGVIIIFHDFTRIKQLENIRKDFVANVSHELRTPLTSIKGYVETLIDGAKDDPAVATKFLHTIHKHSDRLAYLIDDLLTISQLESGQATIDRQHIALRSTVHHIFEELQPIASQKKIHLETTVPADMQVNADAGRLQQVLHNLIDNAIKYGRSGGVVKVGADKVARDARIFVQDDGPGIPPEAKDRVFERFYRVDRARSRDQGGTGLGLAIVKHLVQLHGGKVWVESNLGQGSTFYFTLPEARTAGNNKTPEPLN